MHASLIVLVLVWYTPTEALEQSIFSTVPCHLESRFLSAEHQNAAPTTTSLRYFLHGKGVLYVVARVRNIKGHRSAGINYGTTGTVCMPFVEHSTICMIESTNAV